MASTPNWLPYSRTWTGRPEVNELAQQIASLNVKIAQGERLAQRANDLRDQRDLRMDELSRMVRVTYYETSDGMFNVFMRTDDNRAREW